QNLRRAGDRRGLAEASLCERLSALDRGAPSLRCDDIVEQFRSAGDYWWLAEALCVEAQGALERGLGNDSCRAMATEAFQQASKFADTLLIARTLQVSGRLALFANVLPDAIAALERAL